MQKDHHHAREVNRPDFYCFAIEHILPGTHHTRETPQNQYQ